MANYTKIDELYITLKNRFFIIESILAVMSFFLNFTVIAVFRKTISDQKLKIVNFMFFTQSLTDTEVAITLTIVATVNRRHITANQETQNEYIMFVFFVEYSQYLAINTLAVSTFERLLEIKYPFIHRRYMTFKMACIVATLVFVISAFPAVVCVTYILPKQFSISSEEEYLNFKSLRMRYQITTGVITLSLIVIVFASLLSLYGAIRSGINLRINMYSSQSSSSSKQSIKIYRERKMHRKIVLILLLVCSVYTITYAPGAVIRICFIPLIEEKYSMYVNECIVHSFTVLYFTSSVINPFTTLYFVQDFHSVLMFWLKKMIRSEFRDFIFISRSSESNEQRKRLEQTQMQNIKDE